MKMWQRIVFVLASASLGVLVFPPIGLAWLAIIAWIPLLLALGRAKPSHAFYLGLLHGVMFYGVTMSWLVNVFSSARYAVVPLVLIMALFTALFARGYAVAFIRAAAILSSSGPERLSAISASAVVATRKDRCAPGTGA